MHHELYSEDPESMVRPVYLLPIRRYEKLSRMVKRRGHPRDALAFETIPVPTPESGFGQCPDGIAHPPLELLTNVPCSSRQDRGCSTESSVSK